MSPFSAAMSVCAWIKKLRQSPNSIWFGYCKGGEIVISDSGYFNHWFGGNAAWSNILTVASGEWYHLCLTWSHSSNFLKAYHNGNLIREGGGNPIPVDGNLVMGNDCLNGGNNGNPANNPFGGEMTKLNVFSKELTATEVKIMSDAGLGSDIEETYGLVRRIRWKDILLLPRNGNVAEIEVRGTKIVPGKLPLRDIAHFKYKFPSIPNPNPKPNTNPNPKPNPNPNPNPNLKVVASMYLSMYQYPDI